MAKIKKMQKLQEGGPILKILASLYNALSRVDGIAEDIGDYNILVYHEVFREEDYPLRYNQMVKPLEVYLSLSMRRELPDLKPGECIYKDQNTCRAVVVENINENEAISLIEAHNIILRRFLIEIRSEILDLAYMSIRNGKEYLLQILDNGDMLVLEGGKIMISIPFVKGIISLHTHPNDFCMFSYKDVESFLDFLVEGGLFAGSVSTKCIAGFLRIRLIDEDDYVRLLRMRRRLSKLKKNSFTEYVRVINETNKELESLKLVMATL